jgi:hypothetical protein
MLDGAEPPETPGDPTPVSSPLTGQPTNLVPEARARSQSAVVDERIALVRDMMARGAWHTRASAQELSLRWGIGLDAVRKYAAAASRQLRQATDTLETLEQRAATIGRLERLSAAAEATGELRTSVRAEAEKAKIVGLVSSDVRAVVLVPIGGVELKATVEELRTLLGHVDAFLREKHPAVAAELAAHLVEVKA